MAVKFVVTVEGAQKTPFISGAKQRSMRAFINYCVALMSGSYRPGGASMTVRNAGVPATATVTFTGVPTLTNTVTINGQALTATKRNATGTVTFAALANNDTFTIGGITFTAKTSGAAGEFQFNLGADDTAAAANAVIAVNASNSVASLAAPVKATSALGVVTFRAVNAGTGGNAIALASSNGVRAAVSGALLTGGLANVTNTFDPGNTLGTAAASLAAAVNASTTTKVSSLVSAAAVAGVVTLTSRIPGVTGNLYTLAESADNCTVSGAAFTGGTEDAPFTFSF